MLFLRSVLVFVCLLRVKRLLHVGFAVFRILCRFGFVLAVLHKGELCSFLFRVVYAFSFCLGVFFCGLKGYCTLDLCFLGIRVDLGLDLECFRRGNSGLFCFVRFLRSVFVFGRFLMG